MPKVNLFVTALLTTFGLLIAPISSAQNVSDKPLRIIVPQPPGGGFDFVGRVLADKMAPLIGQSIMVENKTGAGTVVGTDYVAKLPADGSTALVGSISNIVMNPWLYKNLPYDPIKDFEPVGFAISYSYTLIGRKGLPFNTLQGLIQYAKENPGKLTYASGGNGSPQHIGMEMLRQMTGAPLVHIPYKGAAAPVTDVMAGQVPMMISALAVVLPHIKAGKLKAIAITSSKRSLLLQDVPTVAETVPGYELMAWAALVAPKGTPNDVINKLNDAITQVLKDPKMKEQIIAQGFELVPTGQAAYNQANKDGFNRMRKIIKDGGISLD